MTTEREIEIKQHIMRAMSAFGLDRSNSFQSMSFVGLGQMLRGIPLTELISVLKGMDGVVIDLEEHMVRVPTKYFTNA